MTLPTAVGLLLLAMAGVMALLYYPLSARRWQRAGRMLVRGSMGGGRVALTFDDGPAPPFTDQILDILRDQNIPATFFVCGRNVERYPQTLRRIHAERHGLGNHTYSHPFLYLKSRGRMSEEIDATQAAVERVTGVRPSIFRAPYGIRWFGLFSVLRERDMPLIHWSNVGFDWRGSKSPSDITRLALEGLSPGSIILLHDGFGTRPADQFDRSRTVAALPAIIEGARKAGLKFVHVEEFLR